MGSPRILWSIAGVRTFSIPLRKLALERKSPMRLRTGVGR